MRLREMYYLLQDTVDNWISLTYREEKDKSTGTIYYSCTNIEEVAEMLEPLKMFPNVQVELSNINQASPNFFTKKRWSLDSTEFNKVKAALNRLVTQFSAMLDMCEALNLDREPQGFDVKLPPDISLKDAARCMNDLDKVFSLCPLFHKDGDGEIKFNGVDIGSTWLTFTVVAANTAIGLYILQNLAALINQVITIRSNWLTFQQQKEQFKALNMKNELMETMISGYDAALEKMKENAVTALAEEHDITDPEERGRIKLAVDGLSEWINKGMEIYAAIEAPEEIKAIFPPVQIQSLSTDVLKRLKGPVSDSEE